jgi:LuxR family transcriptional regulator, maltose regulon positive regulatory protein
MPKRIPFQMEWHPTSQIYIIQTADATTPLQFIPDSAAWIAWLEGIAAFSINTPSGKTCTIRKETGKRGGAYWYAYRRVQGKIIKRYLGHSADLTQARLATVTEIDDQSISAIQASFSKDQDDKIVLEQTQQETRPSRSPLLLATKLQVPRTSARLISRTHISHRLQQGLDRLLTLILAPAGFGKTTSLCAWIQQEDLRVAWVSLDAGDNDATQFWTYVFTALNGTYHDLARTSLAMLQAPRPPALDTILRDALNMLASQTEDIILVLDDYHYITDPAIHKSLATLMEHPPTQLHLYLTTRHEPPLPLARLRAYDLINMIRAGDLRFRLDEAATFLLDVMEVQLSTEDVMALAERTDGWAAGLHLAGVSLQDHPDPSRFVATFGGSHRHIMAYFGDEVLAAQPTEVQTFLLQTSILDRMCGPLCDAITEKNDSQAMLARLEQANLFLVSLDDEGYWYRYYHPFADMLRHRLQQDFPGLVPELHHRAALWLEAQGGIFEAIDHLFAIPNYEAAAQLLQRAARKMLIRGESNALLRMLDRLPEPIIQAYPHLGLEQARAYFFFGQLEMAEQRINEIEQSLEALPREVILSNEHKIFLREIAAGRATLAAMRGDPATAIVYAQTALQDLPKEEAFIQDSIQLPLGIAYMLKGELGTADRTLAEAARLGLATSNIAIAAIAMSIRSLVFMQQGRLHESAKLCRHIIHLTETQGGAAPSLAGDGYVGLGGVLYEWNDLVESKLAVEKGIAIGKQWANLQDQIEGFIQLAFLYQAQGAPEAANEAFQQAEHFYEEAAQTNRVVPWLPPYLTGSRVRLALRQNQQDVARRWAEGRGLDIPYTPHSEQHLQEYEYLTFARLLIAQGNSNDALLLLENALQSATSEERAGSLIEIYLLQALAFQAQGIYAPALEALRQSLSLAMPEGYIRLYLDEGARSRALHIRLREQSTKGNALRRYIDIILRAFEQSTTDPSLHQSSPVLTETLSTREREVLRLMAQGKSNQEIAHHLVVAVSTVKTHIHHLFAKLQSEDRLQAITRARELGFLE